MFFLSIFDVVVIVDLYFLFACLYFRSIPACTQISVKNRQYASVQEWIQAEIADQRKERRRLEREAHLRSKRLKSRGLLSRCGRVRASWAGVEGCFGGEVVACCPTSVDKKSRLQAHESILSLMRGRTH